MVKTNDIKKGWWIQLQNGWDGVMMDNAKGNTRMVDVNGFMREAGSVYAHDIVHALCPSTKTLIKVEHTPAQLKLKQRLAKMGW